MTKAKETPTRKINGFSRGVNILQIFSYLLMLSKVFFFSFIMVPGFELYLQVTSSIIYYILVLITATFCLLVTTSDPTDKVVLEERRCKLHGEPFDSDRYDFQCNYCSSSVSAESKHCSTCNRCVSEFDHHCKWVNNCIAKSNYRDFVIMVTGLGLTMLWFSINGLLYTIDYYSGRIGIVRDSRMFRYHKNEEWKGFIIAVFTGIVFIFCVLDFKLLYFHIYLIRNNLRTYDYIVKLRERQGKQKVSRSKVEKTKITPIQSPSSADGESENKKNMDIDDASQTILSPEKLTKLLNLQKLREMEKNNGVDGLINEQVIQNQTCDEYDLKHQLSLKSVSSVTHKLTHNHEPGSPSEIQKRKAFQFPSPSGLGSKKIEDILEFSDRSKNRPKADRIYSERAHNRKFSDSLEYDKRNATVKETIRDEAITIHDQMAGIDQYEDLHVKSDTEDTMIRHQIQLKKKLPFNTKTNSLLTVSLNML